MPNRIILYQDSDGEVWHKSLRVDKISFDKASRLGRLHCTDLARNCSILVSICAQPKIEPMPLQPAQPFDFTEFELERCKRDELLKWWYSKTKPF